MAARDLIEKFAAKEKAAISQQIFAPYTPASKYAYIKIDRLTYRFRIVGQNGSGFGVFAPIDATCAKYTGEADVAQVRGYFDVLPSLPIILSYQTEQGWVGYPVNQQSARSSLGLISEVIVRNVTDCQRFDNIVARFDGIHFWYDDVFSGSDPVKSESMRECFSGGHAEAMKTKIGLIKGITPEDKTAFDLAIISWIQFKKLSTETRLKEVLCAGGGKLGSYVLRGANIEVKWVAPSGSNYTTVVNKESLDVVSAGICLSGGDQKFHLKDMPFIVQVGEDRGLIYRTIRPIDME